ncbi:MAG TPA: hypothetical protein VIJ27_14210 [Mucilaginibacter sp.]
MKKLILLFSFSLFFSFGCLAQSAGVGKFNLGLDAALPLYNMRSIFGPGIGGSLKYEYNLSNKFHFLNKPYFLNKLYVTLGSGYESFPVKTVLQNAYVPSTYSYIPVKFGLKYYALNGLYAEGQDGTVFYTQHGGGSSNDFSFGAGYSFKGGFEFGARFERWRQTPQNHETGDYGQTGPFTNVSNFRQIAIRLAERF